MYSYVARQAILDVEEKIVGYELLFRNGVENAFPDICPDQATSQILTSNHLTRGLESITDGKCTYINFFEDTLINRFPESLDPKNVVIEILESVEISEELLDACRALKKQGYRLALDDHNFDPVWDIFLPYIDTIKVDVRQFNILQISKYVRRIAGSGVNLLAEKVETREEFEQLKTLGFQLFQGYFFARPEIFKSKQIVANKLNLLQLISEAGSAQLNIDKVSEILAQDVALSYKLLRFINSAGFSTSQQITSLKHAIVYMGEAEVKKFISLLALANLSGDKPDEIMVLSLARARFCGHIAQMRGDDENPPMAFLVGMLSLVDALLDEPMDALAGKLPIADEIKQGLVEQKGILGLYLKLALSYEQAQWDEVETLAMALKAPIDHIHEFYQESLAWADRICNCERSAA
ncbi:EAL domain-containing protein [Catenovulum agarivorans DS-2]|uniref:EAL domain-containing protein n=1 Tax=Catenovulum agarivorans DS-2 TaxID=1328313 RepID=W7QF71_9ALTE|nr:HDOD domain-containing protein [Catenovulum agarivorans]EWH11549.1 EAL domain-containing protein [Catenovulum agarivorans DS-2]